MICLDANVVIEIILERTNAAACKAYIAAADDDLAITILSVDLIMYYAERNKLNLTDIQRFLRLFVWLPILEADTEWAFTHYLGDDFEDALQIGCTTREGCIRFATLDDQLTKKYSAELPIDLLA